MHFKTFPVIAKFIVVLLLLAGASGFGALYASAKMSAIDSVYSALIDGPAKATVYLARARRFLTAVEMNIFQNLAATTDAGDAATAKSRDDNLERFNKIMDEAGKAAPQINAQLDDHQAKLKAALDSECGEVIRLANSSRDPGSKAKAADLMNTACMPKLEIISESLKATIDSVQDEMDKQSDLATANTNSTRFALLVTIAASTLGIMALSVFLTRKFITLPLTELMSTIAEIGNGRLGTSVGNTDRTDEIGAMAKNVEELRHKLIEAEGLRAEQAKAQAEREQRQRVVAAAVQKFETIIGKVVGTVTSASGQLEQAAESLTKTAGSTQQLSSTVASASEQASVNVQGVAAASEELASTVTEIARQVQESATITGEAVAQAAKTNAQVAQLSEAANRIGDVVSLINNIAGQTNLLALNATIEAARAGDAGKGFAVVALEVKALAAQTEKATNEIAAQITSMQTATTEAVSAIQEIAATIRKVNDISGAIAAAVEEQEATTKEITRNVMEAAKGTSEVASNITDVSNGAVATGSASSQVLSSAKQLAQESENLNREVNSFLSSIRAA